MENVTVPDECPTCALYGIATSGTMTLKRGFFGRDRRPVHILRCMLCNTGAVFDR